MASIKRLGKDKFGVPIWVAWYRRTPGGKLVKKRFHLETKMDVERAVLADCCRSDSGLRWSDGVRIYLDAKKAEGRSPEAMGHVDRAARMFIKVAGDIAVENTTPTVMKEFMQTVANEPIKSDVTGKSHVSGPKVANHHRKELLTVANYLLRHTGKIATVPFSTVPPLPVKRTRRTPVPANRINDYIDALKDYVKGPLLLVLCYGLRSTAICKLTPGSIDGDYLVALDKGNIERRIPIDGLLREIIDTALAYRQQFEHAADRLFVKPTGMAWDRMSLLRAAVTIHIYRLVYSSRSDGAGDLLPYALSAF